MPIIHQLDEFTINQIAAGEIIERPSSIVKELVENSIDAESSAITIEIQDGGIAFIRVTDNGIGMDSDDARLAFERHATSKILSADDLENIVSLGFRGEALASISSVTQMEMITRQRSEISGIKIINHGGSIISLEEIGCPEGTTIITRNLFYNAPARLKFLKSVRAETANISELVLKLILAHPEISIKYIVNGKTIYHSPGNGKIISSIISVYGKDIVDDMIRIEAIEAEMVIKGYIGKPSLSRTNRIHQSFFVNGRYIKSGLLSKCIQEACKDYIMINHFPWAVLHINLPANDVDVNVHPSKTEIKFRREQYIYDIILNIIKNKLERIRYIPSVNIRSESLPSISRPLSAEDDTKDLGIKASGEIPLKASKPKQIYIGEKKDTVEIGINKSDYDNNIDIFADSIPNIIGRIFSTYVIVECDDKIYLIDQHAAHERLIYEQLKSKALNRQMASQELMPPLVLEMTHAEMVILQDNMELFSSLGFEIEHFGGSHFAIRSIPLPLTGMNIQAFFNEVLDKNSELSKDQDFLINQEAIIKKACKKAVKAHDSLSDEEIANLIKEIKNSNIPMTCPHGRPIAITVTQYELEKMFKRIQ